jgi:hypothetical protein
MSVNNVKIGSIFKDTDEYGTVKVTDIFVSPTSGLHLFEVTTEEEIPFTTYADFRTLSQYDHVIQTD